VGAHVGPAYCWEGARQSVLSSPAEVRVRRHRFEIRTSAMCSAFGVALHLASTPVSLHNGVPHLFFCCGKCRSYPTGLGRFDRALVTAGT
jgi:hypothetical protein